MSLINDRLLLQVESKAWVGLILMAVEGDAIGVFGRAAGWSPGVGGMKTFPASLDNFTGWITAEQAVISITRRSAPACLGRKIP